MKQLASLLTDLCPHLLTVSKQVTECSAFAISACAVSEKKEKAISGIEQIYITNISKILYTLSSTVVAQRLLFYSSVL